MAILTETKRQLSERFGEAKRDNVLIGGDESFKADEAFRFILGKFHVSVGFQGGIAHYACFAKE